MNSVKFYHYLPSGDFVTDLDGEEPEYQAKQDGVAIKTLYHLENLSDDSVSSTEDEDDEAFDTAVAMEELDLEATPLPNMIWTPIEYKPKQVAQFILLMQNRNFKVSKAAKEANIEPQAAYGFNRQWKENGRTVLPGYKLASGVKRKGNNVKLTEHHSQFINDYVEENPTCSFLEVPKLLSAKSLSASKKYFLNLSVEFVPNNTDDESVGSSIYSQTKRSSAGNLFTRRVPNKDFSVVDGETLRFEEVVDMSQTGEVEGGVVFNTVNKSKFGTLWWLKNTDMNYNTIIN